MGKKNKEMLSFIEDLCWLLDANSNINYSELAKMIETIIRENDGIESNSITRLSDDIVGILPQLLVDTSLFGSNKQLSQFADELLGIKIRNWEKRSRNEMIGVIICEVQSSNNKKRGITKYLLENILNKKDDIIQYQKQKEANNNPFKWNDAIHQILGDKNE